MPNAPVPAAATGLPSARMPACHAGAHDTLQRIAAHARPAPNNMLMVPNRTLAPLRALAVLRQAVAAEIDRLIAFLDRTEIDADFEATGADFEDGADHEPWLSRPEAAQGRHSAQAGGDDDREADPAEDGVGDADALALIRDERAVYEHFRTRPLEIEQASRDALLRLDRAAARIGVSLPGRCRRL